MLGTRTRAMIGSGAALLLLVGAAAAQQDDEAWLRNCERQGERSGRAFFCEVRPATMDLAAGRLAVDAGPNGGVTVRGGSARGVEVSARVQTQARTDARALEIARAVRVHVSDGQVRADGPATRDRESWSVSYYITVPHRADLDLTTVNGPVGVRDVSGRIRAETTNGPLTLEGLGGDVFGRTRNGPLTVSLSGNRWDGAGIDAETTNGPITLAVPTDYSAALETGSIRGPLSLGFPLTVTLTGRRTDRIEATLGDGGPPIRVVTTNGPATVTRRSERN